MFDEMIKLVSNTSTTDEYGDTVKTSTVKEIPAEKKSIGQTEFYQAQSGGFKVDVKFKIEDYLDYSGEKIIKYQGFGDTEESIYEVKRTYRDGNQLEITCSKGVG